MFSRTPSGLNNEAQFYGVDVVLYCEGRRNESNVLSLDEAFWRTILDEHGIKAECKGFGSKNNLLELANEVIKEGVSDVIVACDRDYDDFYGCMIDHPQLFYTYGYSWESDLVLGFDLLKGISTFIKLRKTKDIEKSYEKFIDLLSKNLHRPTVVDLKYYRSPRALFDRDKPLSICDLKDPSFPKVDHHKILKCAKSIGPTKVSDIDDKLVAQIDSLRNFFGKTTIRLVYKWMVFTLRSLNVKYRVDFDFFAMCAIASWNAEEKNVPCHVHYYNICERFREL